MPPRGNVERLICSKFWRKKKHSMLWRENWRHMDLCDDLGWSESTGSFLWIFLNPAGWRFQKESLGQTWTKCAAQSSKQQLASVFQLGQGTSQIISRRVTLWHKSSAKNRGLCSFWGNGWKIESLVQIDTAANSSILVASFQCNIRRWKSGSIFGHLDFGRKPPTHSPSICIIRWDASPWVPAIGDETAREQRFPNGTDRTSLNWFAA